MLLYLSVFTIILSVLLAYYNWKSNKSALLLSLVFILTSLFGIAYHFMAFAQSSFWLAIFYNNFAPFMYLIGPLVLFYVRNTLLDRNTFKISDSIHFIPTLIALIGTLPYLFSSFDEKLQYANRILNNVDAIRSISVNLFYSASENFTYRTLLIFIYLTYSLFLVCKAYSNEKKGGSIQKKQIKLAYLWLLVLLISLLLIFANFSALSLFALFSSPSKTIETGQILYLIAGLAYSFLSFSLLLFPEILYGIPRKKELEKTKEKIIINPEEDPFFDLSKKITAYLEKEKPYLKNTFALSDISLALKVPQNHVSYCITYLMDTKFTSLKNQLRVRYAIELLSNKNLSSMTIETIGKKSGFKTRSNFYAVFKEETALTPSEFIEKLKNQ